MNNIVGKYITLKDKDLLNDLKKLRAKINREDGYSDYRSCGNCKYSKYDEKTKTLICMNMCDWYADGSEDVTDEEAKCFAQTDDEHWCENYDYDRDYFKKSSIVESHKASYRHNLKEDIGEMGPGSEEKVFAQAAEHARKQKEIDLSDDVFANDISELEYMTKDQPLEVYVYKDSSYFRFCVRGMGFSLVNPLVTFDYYESIGPSKISRQNKETFKKMIYKVHEDAILEAIDKIKNKPNSRYADCEYDSSAFSSLALKKGTYMISLDVPSKSNIEIVGTFYNGETKEEIVLVKPSKSNCLGEEGSYVDCTIDSVDLHRETIDFTITVDGEKFKFTDMYYNSTFALKKIIKYYFGN